MVMHSGEHWHCTNRVCGCSIVVESETPNEGVNPRCSCGALMKKEYKSPVFRYLDFLHVEQPLVAAAKQDKEG